MKLLSKLTLILAMTMGAVSVAATDTTVSDKTMKAMGVFLSNFTECGLYDTTREEMTADNEKLLDFAICHLRINAWNSSFSPVPGCEIGDEEKCPHGDHMVAADKVARVVKKYLDYDMKKHSGNSQYYYKDGFYYIYAADGEQTMNAVARKVRKLDNGNFEVSSSLFNTETQDKPKTSDIHMVSVIRPYVFESKNTWSLVSTKLLVDIGDIDTEPEIDYSQFNPASNPKFPGFWEDDVTGKSSLEIMHGGDGVYTVVVSHAMGASERVECTYHGKLENNMYLKLGESLKCVSIESQDDGSPDRMTVAESEFIETMLINKKGRLIIPIPCDEQDGSEVKMCEEPYQRVKRN